MYYSFGRIVRKAQPTVTIMTDLPNTVEYNASHAVVGSYASGGPIPTSETSSSIVYSLRSKRFPKRSNFCAHSIKSMAISSGTPLAKITNARLDPPHAGWTADTWWDYGASYNAHIAAIPIALGQLGPTGLGKLQANWQSYAVSGFTALQPDLTKLSLPNFLIDIEQIGGLASDIRPFLDDFKGLAKFVGSTKLSKLDKAKSAAKLAAEKRLSYKFGWKPTIGDVQAMLDSVISLDIRLQAFKQSIGKELSYTKTLESVDVGKAGTFNLSNDVHYRVNWAGSLNGKVQYHAKYQPQPLAVLGPLDEKIRSVLDHFGVELNPQILWDAIPFSFVLDWFTGFGSWLGQFKVDALELPIQVIDSAVSYKETYRVGSNVVINPNGYPTDSSSTTKPAGYWTDSRFFHRMPVDPSLATYRQLGWKNPSGSQWTNLVSLATVLGL